MRKYMYLQVVDKLYFVNQTLFDVSGSDAIMIDRMFTFIGNNYQIFFMVCIVIFVVGMILFFKGKKKSISIAVSAIGLLLSIIGIAVSIAQINAQKPEDALVHSSTQEQESAKDSIVSGSDGELETDKPVEIETPEEPSTEDAEDMPLSENSVEIGTPFVSVSPQNQITNGYLNSWDEENDRDIIGNTYPAAMKLSVSNMIDAMFGYGESEITADVHIPFGGKGEGIWIVSFVAAQDMVGNGSTAEVTILADGEELYPVFTLSSTTTDELAYEIELAGIRDLVFHFDCTAIGSGFCAGIVLEEK